MSTYDTLPATPGTGGTSSTSGAGSVSGTSSTTRTPGTPASSPDAKTAVTQAASEAGQQAQQVLGEAKEKAASLAQQAKHEVQSQVDQRSQQATEGLRRMAGQIGSLASGRPEEAMQLQSYLFQAQDKLESLASRLESGGPQTFVEDVRSFARRRPGTFVVASVGAGFLVGRLVRAGKAASDSNGSSPAIGYPSGYPSGYGTLPSGASGMTGMTVSDMESVPPPSPMFGESPAAGTTSSMGAGQ